MNNAVDVSVVVATYRREAELKRALESLSKQTIDSFEIIVADDNDNSGWNLVVEKIINDFKKNNPKIPIIYLQNHPNLGSAKNRNTGIEKAGGKYITFLDDDDIYLPDKIKKQYLFMEENGLDYSVTDLDLYFDSGKLFEHKKRNYIKSTDKESLFRYHFMYHITGTDTMMFKKDYITDIGMFAPIDVGDEFYLMHRAIENEGKFGYLDECEVKAYVHTGVGGLSSGEQKILGENNLFEFKKSYFNRFDKGTVKFVKTRHYAVIAFAYLRMKKYAKFIKNAVLAFFSSPSNCVKILFER